MTEKGTEQPAVEGLKKALNRRVHMANERTFLAWIRTSIGLMAFGFVVERFALFMRQFFYYSERLGLPLQKSAAVPVSRPSSSYSFALGVFLVGLGSLMAALSFLRYKKVKKQIEEDAYYPSVSLDVALTIAVLATGIFLLIYLVHSYKAFVS